MKILGINGSHRKKSTTAAFLKKALSVCRKEDFEAELIELHNKEIKHCRACDRCKNGKCPLKDDAEDIFDRMKNSDGIIIASPTYFGNITGKLKTFFDRTISLRRGEGENKFRLKDKVGGAITAGASRNGGQEFANIQIRNFFLLQEMIVVGDSQTAHFGGIGWVPRGSGPEKDETGMDTCRNLGKKMCRILKRF